MARSTTSTAALAARDGDPRPDLVVDRSIEDVGALAVGFQHAADLVVAEWDRSPLEVLVPPAFWLYRRAIELGLERAIAIAGRDSSSAGPPVRSPDVGGGRSERARRGRLDGLRHDLDRSLASLGLTGVGADVADLVSELDARHGDGDVDLVEMAKTVGTAIDWIEAISVDIQEMTSQGRQHHASTPHC